MIHLASPVFSGSNTTGFGTMGVQPAVDPHLSAGLSQILTPPAQDRVTFSAKKETAEAEQALQQAAQELITLLDKSQLGSIQVEESQWVFYPQKNWQAQLTDDGGLQITYTDRDNEEHTVMMDKTGALITPAHAKNLKPGTLKDALDRLTVSAQLTILDQHLKTQIEEGGPNWFEVKTKDGRVHLFTSGEGGAMLWEGSNPNQLYTGALLALRAAAGEITLKKTNPTQANIEVPQSRPGLESATSFAARDQAAGNVIETLGRFLNAVIGGNGNGNPATQPGL